MFFKSFFSKESALWEIQNEISKAESEYGPVMAWLEFSFKFVSFSI